MREPRTNGPDLGCACGGAIALLMAIFAAGVACGVALGDDDAAAVEWEATWVRRGPPITKRIAIVLDASGSMRGAPIERARAELVTILSLFPDDGYVKAYAFDDGAHELDGGWRQLPDAEVLNEIAAWLAGFDGAGNTNLAAGLRAALANPEDDVSVIVVTDGEVSGGNEIALDKVADAQKARAVGPAPIHVIAVHELEATDDALALERELAERNDGGLVVLAARRRLAEGD